MKRKIVFTSLIIILSTFITPACAVFQTANTKHFNSDQPPEYVMPLVAALDSLDKTMVQANAVLIDRENGLFVVNAHVLDENPKKIIIKVFDQWYSANTQEDWISWATDLSILKLDSAVKSLLPEPAVLSKLPPLIHSQIAVKGYLAAQLYNNPSLELKVESFSVKGFVKSTEANWGVSLNNHIELLELMGSLALTGSIPRSEFVKLYWGYVLIETQMDQTFESGLSGSPVIMPDNKVVGIISAVSPHHALAIPAFEIEILWQKVKADLKKIESSKQ